MAEENPITDEMRQARALLMAMTEEQRGLVLCWFCSCCRRYQGPGDHCTCSRDEAEDESRLRAECLRDLARHLENRFAGPSLEGYSLVDGLRAAADLLEGKPGPLVHSDCSPGSDAIPPRVALTTFGT